MKRLLTVLLVWGLCQAGGAQVEKGLKVDFENLAARAEAAIETVNAMEERARAAGEALHPALLEQRNLVRASMDAAEESLRASDNAGLRERLKRARAHIDKLYTMI
jgi:hypothetical protein